MPQEPLIVTPGIHDRTVRVQGEGQRRVPDDWVLVPPGDPGLTRRVKAGGSCYVVQERRGRRTFSRGVWAPGARVEAVRAALEAERAAPSYAKKQAAAAQRRERKQSAYVDEFAESTINLRCWIWVHPTERWTVKDTAMRNTKRALDAAGITIAFPQRVLHDASS